MRPIGGFFYCFTCQPYKQTNQACRGSWEQKHFLFLSFFPLPLFFVLAFFIFIAIVQRSAEGQKVFILTLWFPHAVSSDEWRSLYCNHFTAASCLQLFRITRILENLGAVSLSWWKNTTKTSVLEKFRHAFSLGPTGCPWISQDW